MDQMVARIDDFGKPAWIALMVLGFIVFWPIGLAVLAYMLWSGRMGCARHGGMSRWQQRMADKWERHGQRGWGGHRGWGGPQRAWSSGNRTFDEYREATINRLEDESREFREFLERLRMAKDRSEFDQFMADRRQREAKGPDAPEEGNPQPS